MTPLSRTRQRPGRRRVRPALATAAAVLATGGALVASASATSTASATAPDRLAMPASVSFDPVTLGSSATPTRRTVTVRSQQLLPTAPLSVSLAGTDAADFAVVADTCSDRLLSAGATCSITVAFAPTTVGTKTAALRVAGWFTSAQSTLTAEALPDPSTNPQGPYPYDPGPSNPATGP